MPIPEFIPAEKRQYLQHAVDALMAVEGIVAIVLGGSYARGTQHTGSDLDLGLYYSESAPFAVADVRRVAEHLSNGVPPVVTDFYEWGPWVNGGAWIQTPAGKIDFLYRSIEHVQRTIEEAHQGIHHHHYGQQPTFGFYSVIYLAETQICIPLVDEQGIIAGLKASVATYPPKLQQAIIGDMLWSAEFTALFAHKYADMGDVYNTVGCITRIAGNLTQALFALNRQYFMTDKRVSDAIQHFTNCPPAYVERLNQLLASPGATSDQLSTTMRELYELWQEVVLLTRGEYTPKFAIA